MAQINNDLETLKTARDNMKTALEGKGQTVTKDIRTYAAAISNIPTGGGDVKLFETVEEMQLDPSPNEGDLAVVYRNEIQPVTGDSEFSSCIFPNEVVLDEVFTDSISGMFRAVDDSWFDGNVDMSSSSFRFDGFGETMVSVTYTSNDGITYTRTDGGEELQEFGTIIKWGNYEPWNDVIGNFMKIGGSVFEGIYEYNLDVVDKDNIWFARTNDISFDYNGSSISNVVCSNPYFESISTNSIVKIFNYLKLNANIDSNLISVARKSDGKLIVLAAYSLDSNSYRDYGLQYMGYDANKNYLGLISDWNSSNTQIHYWVINEETFELQSIVPTVLNAQLSVIKNYAGFSLNLQTVVRTYSYMNNSFVGSLCIVCGNSTQTVKQYIDNVAGKDCIYKKYDKYVISVNQLDATSEYVYEKTFYGKNGVEDGTLTTNVSNSFADINAEVYAKLQQQYDNMQPRILTDQDKSIDGNIRTIPCKSDGTPLLDTSNVTNMENMFANHKGLVCIPLIDTSSVTNMSFMLAGCPLLVTLPQLDTSNVTNMGSMFSSCLDLRELPQFNTINVTSMSCMLAGCSNLITVPQLNTSNVTDMGYMFDYCSHLSNESLNNILAMCANATKMSSNKTLKKIGITQEQAQICTTLSNYSAFVNAGWTTGY